MRGWAGRPRGRPLVFPRLTFPSTQFARSVSDWTSTQLPQAVMPPKDFAEKLEAARQALSQTRVGFGAPSGLAYEPTASAFPWDQPWNAPNYRQPDPRKESKKKPVAAMPSPLKQLPHDWIPPHERPKFAQDIVDLQGLTAGGTGQQDMEEQMDQSGSHVSPSEIGSEGCSERSVKRPESRATVELSALQHLAIEETESEQNDRQAMEAAYVGSPDTIQGQTGDNGEEDESDSKEDSNEEDEEESKTSPVVEAKGAEPSGGGPEGRGVDG